MPAGTIAARPGRSALEIFDGLARGDVRVVWILGTNPAASMPDTDVVEKALRQADLVVVQDAYHPTETTRFADVLLPAAQWPEKDGVMTNSERRLTYLPKLVEPPGEAQPDATILVRSAFFDLRGRRCLVVVGGAVGERKVHDLLACAARVTVVSPAVTPALRDLAGAGTVDHRARRFRRSDARGCTLVIAATGAPDVDRVVVAAARRHRALVNVVDRPGVCDFIFGSVLRRVALQIAVSTGGRSPALAREIRRRLEPQFGPEYAGLVEHIGRLRTQARAAARTRAARLAAGERVAVHAFEGREDL